MTRLLCRLFGHFPVREYLKRAESMQERAAWYGEECRRINPWNPWTVDPTRYCHRCTGRL